MSCFLRNLLEILYYVGEASQPGNQYSLLHFFLGHKQNFGQELGPGFIDILVLPNTTNNRWSL